MSTAIFRADAGSFAFESSDDRAAELATLHHQATVATQLELDIWQRLGLRPGHKVVDLSCGPGVITCELARHVMPTPVVGIDSCRELLGHAERYRARKGLGNARFQFGNVNQLDLPEDTFDFAYARFLFQELADAPAAIENIMRVLRPGGILCAVDVDENWLSLEPCEDAFLELSKLVALGNNAAAGDRYIGHRLGGLFHAAGLEQIETNIVPITTNDIGVPAFLQIATGGKLKQVPSEYQSRAEELLRELHAMLDATHAWGAAGIFVASARKPA